MNRAADARTKTRHDKPFSKPPQPPTHARRAAVAEQLAALPVMQINDLWALWDAHFSQRPKNHHRTFIESRLAYRIQERAFGALAPATVRLLERIGETGEVPGHQRKEAQGLVPGAVLVRTYNEVAHRVTVLPDGRFEWRGQPYKSLSAIANAITGGHISGPRFFGIALPRTQGGAA